MKKRISAALLRLLGWKIGKGFPKDLPRCIVIMAPHTSLWDFVIGRLVFNVLEVNVRFLIKREAFWWPLGPWLKSCGGIPVDRHRSNNMVTKISRLFRQHTHLYVLITPEGTRSLVKRWKRGFYYIATRADVPIVLSTLDFERKEAYVGPVIHPSGHFKTDFTIIRNFYMGKKGKHPERFNL
ncbi:MAG: 1-acyl-sn-glycerol-3-phosphate acyltransferase [Bacteroidales bacterium]|nr:1-acyl-sn-glycerol-3-phosphate acyltransferase [Bacteroidales bacterium]MDD2323875.1 1-acyl-sn-glycerol-3-phosphate acyltransferase [Bacteroidales bacterium]MDD3011867.1 1-acyl-sn-glycerol-3-phosphate acyltransferase [Bacteroidales bacterium]MDD3962192.1 1-acyl-sn-glycerol-3-phosphate acyltransferase [Bacteroidales bacterium]MDY0284718.1 1-acyl-sn-glycerol-3-phosphate acyltransferase [Bacteroidales bacterium]